RAVAAKTGRPSGAGARPTVSTRRYRSTIQAPSVSPTRSGPRPSAHQLERTARPPLGVEADGPRWEPDPAGLPGMLRPRPSHGQKLHREATPGQPPGTDQERTRVAGRDHHQLGARPDELGHAAEQCRERCRGKRAEPGEQVADPATLAWRPTR